MAVSQNFEEVRKLLTDSAAVQAPVRSADIAQIEPAFYGAEDIWPAYQSLPFAQAAGLAGLYAIWMHRALADNMAIVDDLNTEQSQLLSTLVDYIASDEELHLRKLLENRSGWDQLFLHLQTWYVGLSGSGRKFQQKLDELCEEIAQGPEQWGGALGAFNQACDKELDRAAMLAERMQTSELGRIKAAHAEHKVADLYNQAVAGRELPESTLSFIDEVILPSLQYLLINQSEHDADWNFWVKMLRLIVWAVQPEKSEADRQAFFSRGPALLTQLESAEASRVCSDQAYQNYINELSGHIITLLKGQAIETVTAARKQVSAESESLKQLQQSGAQHQFSVGDWIEFDDGEQLIRCQFLVQAPGTDLLLFVNRSGHKVLQKTVDEMSACFKAGIAREIPPVPVMSAAIRACNARMAQLQQQLEAEARQQAAEREAREQRQREQQAAREREQALRKEAEAKARAEALRLAEEREARERAEKARQAAEVREAHEQSMRDLLDNLTLGTWADLPVADGKTTRCKLAVSMRSTGKYIFVDRVGTKVAELKYDELLGYLIEGRAVFYQPEQGFENRLESIVRGLRRTE